MKKKLKRKPGSGGKRQGAGRKSTFKEASAVLSIRVPSSKLEVLKATIKESNVDVADALLLAIHFTKKKELKFNRNQLRYIYDAGMANIDSDGCHIDNPDEDFKVVLQNLHSSS